ncbi:MULTISPECIES: HNH endonuclease [unclassified Acinetobacter]|uniref:HNH endonuclease n=1 Tax=unclassified Acinetobacter TaxID=196816 RepID=UPI001F4BB814|nr:HNH endonuclease [Acinetobacter sp. NIPH 2023]MCH7359131.1 HNH endonuclease [Acinetobacter sp. NIPH 2024]
MNGLFTCLYCGSDKQQSESSLEHAIPQFMGGECAPKKFQLTNVCRQCNNGLGLWVDASYAKSWFVTNQMAEAAQLLCTKVEDPGLPLRYIGKMKISNLKMPDEYISEHWVGPFGETIAWIRPHDERMDSYAGGNPTETKKKQSVAFFFPTAKSLEKNLIGIRSFHRFLKKRKVRKILCAQFFDSQENAISPEIMGFDSPNSEDLTNRDIIRQLIQKGSIRGQIIIDTKFDQRFICKLMLGIGYALFDEDFLENSTVIEARRGVWPKKDGEISKIHGASTYSLLKCHKFLGAAAGYPGAVVITIMRISDSWSMCVTINEKFPFIIELGPITMTSQYINPEEGYVLLLFPYIEESIELTATALFAHQSGRMKNSKLKQIDEKLEMANIFNLDLSIV